MNVLQNVGSGDKGFVEVMVFISETLVIRYWEVGTEVGDH